MDTINILANESIGPKIWFRLKYRNISPINAALCFLIVFLNSLAVSGYYQRQNRKKITFVLFLMISISDITTAVGNLVFSGGVIMWSRDTETYDAMMWWCLVFYRATGLLGYSCSVLLNTLLAVLRALKLYNPFYQPRFLVVVIIGVVYVTLLIALTGYDNVPCT